MKIACYLGFGWPAIALALASGVAINALSGPIVWPFYLPFLGSAMHMTRRFRLFNQERWRRVHARAMALYAPMAAQEFEAARRQQRDFDIAAPCRALARALFPHADAAQLEVLLGPQRKAYFQALVDACAPTFVQGVTPERQSAVLGGIKRDIEASALGPDAVIVRAIEQQLGQVAAAQYFRARLLGRIN